MIMYIHDCDMSRELESTLRIAKNTTYGINNCHICLTLQTSILRRQPLTMNYTDRH